MSRDTSHDRPRLGHQPTTIATGFADLSLGRHEGALCARGVIPVDRCGMETDLRPVRSLDAQKGSARALRPVPLHRAGRQAARCSPGTCERACRRPSHRRASGHRRGRYCMSASEGHADRARPHQSRPPPAGSTLRHASLAGRLRDVPSRSTEVRGHEVCPVTRRRGVPFRCRTGSVSSMVGAERTF